MTALNITKSVIVSREVLAALPSLANLVHMLMCSLANYWTFGGPLVCVMSYFLMCVWICVCERDVEVSWVVESLERSKKSRVHLLPIWVLQREAALTGLLQILRSSVWDWRGSIGIIWQKLNIFIHVTWKEFIFSHHLMVQTHWIRWLMSSWQILFIFYRKHEIQQCCEWWIRHVGRIAICIDTSCPRLYANEVYSSATQQQAHVT